MSGGGSLVETKVSSLLASLVFIQSFVIDLLELVLENSVMEFHGEYFQQIFGIIMGTNVAPILANLYLAKLEKNLQEKTKNNPTNY